MLDHIGIAISDIRQSEAFYAAALAPLEIAKTLEFGPDKTESGGTAIGFGGLRPKYHPDYYGAFVFDPDGVNVEAVSQRPD